jgi:8-oxo-dGTP pyrophosphatase MutT (NUDIX family)
VKPQSVQKFSVEPSGPAKAQQDRGAGVQYAALPYRWRDGVEVLLITSRETGRWVLPKGWPMKGMKPHAAAAREALEEAGIKGKVGKSAIGSYSYGKRLPQGVLACTVEVYPLAVDRQMTRWPERGQRTLAWFSASEAAGLVEEADLASLLRAFALEMAR